MSELSKQETRTAGSLNTLVSTLPWTKTIPDKEGWYMTIVFTSASWRYLRLVEMVRGKTGKLFMRYPYGYPNEGHIRNLESHCFQMRFLGPLAHDGDEPTPGFHGRVAY